MITSGRTYIMAVDEERLIVTPNPVPFDSENGQKTALNISLRNGSGSGSSPLKAYVRVIVQQGLGSAVPNELGTHILNTKNAGGYVADSDFSFTMPNDTSHFEYGKANQFKIEVYDNYTQTSTSFPSDSKYLLLSEIVTLNREAPDYTPRTDAWSASNTYRNGEYFVSDNIIYIWIYPIPGNTAQDPLTHLKSNPYSAYWKSVEKKEFLATAYFFADNARMADFIVKKTSNGSVFKSADLDSDNIPNLSMNSKTGEMKCNKLNAKGQITSYSTDADAGNTKVEIANGFINIWGKVARNIEIGVDSDGLAILRYYNNNGVMLYDLGVNGLRNVTVTASGWEEVEMFVVNLSTTEVGEWLSSLMYTRVWKENVGTKITCYRYTAERIGATYTKPEEKAYDGKLFSAKNTSSGFISNGWYYAPGTIAPTPNDLMFPPEEYDGSEVTTEQIPDLSPYNETVLMVEDIYSATIECYVQGSRMSMQAVYWNS